MKKSKILIDNLSVQWSRTDSEGLTRVVPTDSFRTGFVVIAKIGPLAEALDYYPELLMARDRVVVSIDDSDEAKASKLAKQIDALLDETLG